MCVYHGLLEKNNSCKLPKRGKENNYPSLGITESPIQDETKRGIHQDM